MGGILISRNDLISSTAETIGYKAGLALTREEFNEIIPKKYHRYWFGQDGYQIRIRSEEYEDLIANLLYSVGNISTPNVTPFSVSILKRSKKNPELYELYSKIMPAWIAFLKQQMLAPLLKVKKNIDPKPFVEDMKKQHGLAGELLSIEIIKGMNMQLHVSPWALQRSVEWRDTAELRDLFKSNSLETQYGTFFDQRFIDYLQQNFDRIDEMHWRKFEALTCEFFERHGYYVEIGPGSDDDGVDARCWNQNPDNGGPPTILVQCKRRQDKVDKGVVKSLYADVLYENAGKGLIVTTQSLSPGAEEVRKTRAYPIEQADRVTLKKWLEVLRTPGNGIFMSD